MLTINFQIASICSNSHQLIDSLSLFPSALDILLESSTVILDKIQDFRKNLASQMVGKIRLLHLNEEQIASSSKPMLIFREKKKTNSFWQKI